VAAEDWWPYSPRSFPTPPFPGYVSGHSTVSAASARMLEHLTGSDRFGVIAHHRAGIYTETACDAATMQARDGRPGAAASLDVVIDLPTFSRTAELAGLSRVLGGYHIQADNAAGLALGRAVADATIATYRAYFAGTAAPRP
jgi:hypothetical protein